MFPMILKWIRRACYAAGLSLLFLIPAGEAAAHVPLVIDKSPGGEERCFDRSDFKRVVIPGLGENPRYFLTVTFDDPEQELQPTAEAIERISLSAVYSGGSQVSMIDTQVIHHIDSLTAEERENFINRYIFHRDAQGGRSRLYIPVMGLSPGNTYHITINPGIVEDEEEHENDPINWELTMIPIPVITGITPACVPEQYDKKTPLFIRGKNFYDGGNLQVKFNHIPVPVIESSYDEGSGESTLLVYLPSHGIMEAGLYNITVINSPECQQTLYGVFSVVAAAKTPVGPEKEIISTSDSKWQLISNNEYNQETLLLQSGAYSKNETLQFKLDELMGKNMIGPTIILEGYRLENLWTIIVSSAWLDTRLYGIRAVFPPAGKVSINTGKVEPALKGYLQAQLRPFNLRSEMVQVDIKNASVQLIILKIPFEGSDDNLKLLCYDRNNRSWEESSFSVDKLNRTVQVITNKPGIYVVVN